MTPTNSGPLPMRLCRWVDQSFFSLLERLLIRRVDAVVSVNPMLSEAIRSAYGLDHVHSVPNVEPWVEHRERPAASPLADLAKGRVKFLFQGRFSPARGIEEIITAWRDVDGTRAALFLRGPDNAWKAQAIKLAAGLGLLNKSVFFLDAVGEDDLVMAAAEADVGIIPYLPTAINERLSCPNKLSQYLHAGLMIIANELPYVRSVVEQADVGLIYDSADLQTFAQAVKRVIDDPELLACMPTECVAVCPRRLQLAKARRSLSEALSRGIRHAGWRVASGKCRCPAGVVGRQGHDRKGRVSRRLAAETVSRFKSCSCKRRNRAIANCAC